MKFIDIKYFLFTIVIIISISNILSRSKSMSRLANKQYGISCFQMQPLFGSPEKCQTPTYNPFRITEYHDKGGIIFDFDKKAVTGIVKQYLEKIPKKEGEYLLRYNNIKTVLTKEEGFMKEQVIYFELHFGQEVFKLIVKIPYNWLSYIISREEINKISFQLNKRATEVRAELAQAKTDLISATSNLNENTRALDRIGDINAQINNNTRRISDNTKLVGFKEIELLKVEKEMRDNEKKYDDQQQQIKKDNLDLDQLGQRIKVMRQELDIEKENHQKKLDVIAKKEAQVKKWKIEAEMTFTTLKKYGLLAENVIEAAYEEYKVGKYEPLKNNLNKFIPYPDLIL